ncbi:MAG: hypothetical protein KDD45_14570 [Bdellovibrionales bacterium]|nr:hypothetical protein [Bdellovibrionales bacterium]
MGLKFNPVSKCLDKKTLIWGFEMADILIVFLALAVLNLLFGETNNKLLLVWAPPFLLALVLRYGKKGKPDNYLVHWVRYQFSPGVYCAFKGPKECPVPPRLNREVA